MIRPIIQSLGHGRIPTFIGRIGVWSCAIFGVLVIAGCAALRPSDQGSAAGLPQTPAPEIVPLSTAPEPSADPAPQPTPQITIEPDGLLDLTRGELAALLGSPDLLRIEEPSQVWQYAGAECVLFVFLYPSENPSEPVVHHAETRPREDQGPTGADCIGHIFEEAGTDDAGIDDTVADDAAIGDAAPRNAPPP